MPYREDLTVPSDVKGWGDPRPWSDVEQAVVAALASMITRTPGTCGFTLAYVPRSGLGEADGVDLSWEVDTGLPHTGVERYELAGHPAVVVEELALALATDGPITVPAEVAERLDRAGDLWRGWSPLLVDLARLSCHLPDDAEGFDLSVGFDPGHGAREWSWTVAIPVPGTEWPASEWEADDPGQALRAALAEADIWLSGRPAGHLRQ
ncbi:hypothetical protein ACFFKU_14330 [Kineococcus gynurae]|uniref:Suppressor of fused protein SUFU n=1 Tax=Kineococcus gynurae TaxID=452979 RepID=A0ABV5LTV9_9ACTN